MVKPKEVSKEKREEKKTSKEVEVKHYQEREGIFLCNQQSLKRLPKEVAYPVLYTVFIRKAIKMLFT